MGWGSGVPNPVPRHPHGVSVWLTWHVFCSSHFNHSSRCLCCSVCHWVSRVAIILSLSKLHEAPSAKFITLPNKCVNQATSIHLTLWFYIALAYFSVFMHHDLNRLYFKMLNLKFVIWSSCVVLFLSYCLRHSTNSGSEGGEGCGHWSQLLHPILEENTRGNWLQNLLDTLPRYDHIHSVSCVITPQYSNSCMHVDTYMCLCCPQFWSVEFHSQFWEYTW